MTEKSSVPAHVAIIMDGNGRWAEERKLPRAAGHYEGAKRVSEIVIAAKKAGVKVLTMYTFSTENWSRPKAEVDALMNYLVEFLKKDRQRLSDEGVRFRAIGSRERFPEKVLDAISESERLTEHNKDFTLVLALDYGGRQEIIAACRELASRAVEGKVKPQEIDEAAVEARLCTAGLPDPDLLIRTSGEQRISNFLLWQLSYAEFYFPKTYWPDFKEADLLKALEEYASRRRRYGGIC
jgi:undecaprenyl diphosphate synthase